MKKLPVMIEGLRFEILAGFVLCERDLNEFASLKEEAYIEVGCGRFFYENAQFAINKLKSAYPSYYHEFRRELLKKVVAVTEKDLLNSPETHAGADVRNQAALYCNIMCELGKEMRNEYFDKSDNNFKIINEKLVEYMDCYGLEG